MPTTLLEYALARAWLWDKARQLLTSDLPARVDAYNAATGYAAALQTPTAGQIYCGLNVIDVYRAGQYPNVGDTVISVYPESSTPNDNDIAGSQGDEVVVGIAGVVVCNATTIDAAMRNAESLCLLALATLHEGLIDPPGTAKTAIWRIDPETSATSTTGPMGRGLFFVAATASIRVYMRMLQTTAPRRMVDGSQGSPFVAPAADTVYSAPRLFTAVDGTSARTTLVATLESPGAYTVAASSVAVGAVVGVDWGASPPAAGTTMLVVAQKAPSWPSDSATLATYAPEDDACIVDTSGAIGNPSAGDVWLITVTEPIFDASRTVRVTWS